MAEKKSARGRATRLSKANAGTKQESSGAMLDDASSATAVTTNVGVTRDAATAAEIASTTEVTSLAADGKSASGAEEVAAVTSEALPPASMRTRSRGRPRKVVAVDAANGANTASVTTTKATAATTKTTAAAIKNTATEAADPTPAGLAPSGATLTASPDIDKHLVSPRSPGRRGRPAKKVAVPVAPEALVVTPAAEVVAPAAEGYALDNVAPVMIGAVTTAAVPGEMGVVSTAAIPGVMGTASVGSTQVAQAQVAPYPYGGAQAGQAYAEAKSSLSGIERSGMDRGAAGARVVGHSMAESRVALASPLSSTSTVSTAASTVSTAAASTVSNGSRESSYGWAQPGGYADLAGSGVTAGAGAAGVGAAMAAGMPAPASALVPGAGMLGADAAAEVPAPVVTPAGAPEVDPGDEDFPWLNALNQEQRAAVKQTEGYICLHAGAGTGKTRTLAYRYAFLINELGIAPRSVWCVTFTNKAAAEMKKRVASLCGSVVGNPFVTTFHGFCSMFLREEIQALGWPKTFTICDVNDVKDMIRPLYKECGVDGKKLSLTKAWASIDTLKETLDYLPTLVGANSAELLWRSQNSAEDENKIFWRYLFAQRTTYSLDFDDLILFTLHILKHYPEVRERWQKRFDYILVDEFQDIDRDQYELVEIMAGQNHNLFVVGDPDQTIYSFRGAQVEFFNQFASAHAGLESHQLYLTYNYRSQAQILQAAYHVISHNYDEARRPLVARRQDITLEQMIAVRDPNTPREEVMSAEVAAHLKSKSFLGQEEPHSAPVANLPKNQSRSNSANTSSQGASKATRSRREIKRERQLQHLGLQTQARDTPSPAVPFGAASRASWVDTAPLYQYQSQVESSRAAAALEAVAMLESRSALDQDGRAYPGTNVPGANAPATNAPGASALGASAPGTSAGQADDWAHSLVAAAKHKDRKSVV